MYFIQRYLQIHLENMGHFLVVIPVLANDVASPIFYAITVLFSCPSTVCNVIIVVHASQSFFM